MFSRLAKAVFPTNIPDYHLPAPIPPSPLSKVSPTSPSLVALVATHTGPHAPAPNTPTGPTISTKINKVTFEAVASLTNKTDAIVNPTDDELQLDGKLSKGIVSKGGSVITEEYRTRERIPADGTVINSGEALMPPRGACRVPRRLAGMPTSSAGSASGSGRLRVQISLVSSIGTGWNGLPLNPVAGSILDTIVDAMNQNSSGSLTRLVRLVGFTV